MLKHFSETYCASILEPFASPLFSSGKLFIATLSGCAKMIEPSTEGPKHRLQMHRLPKRARQCCLHPLNTAEAVFHKTCCKKLFGTTQPPVFPYGWDEINDLAKQIISRHITVPGVQPKLSLHLDRSGRSRDTRLTRVGLEGGYILKPPVEDYPEMPELEQVTMQMAKCIGITTAECGLIKMENRQLAFITKRMDRIKSDTLHMEDLCQLTDRLTEQKYRGSMEQAGKTILRYCDNALFDALRFFELAVFCFLTGNSDMHLKNFSLLYPLAGPVSLSPAYDLLPTQLLLPTDTEESALTLNGRKNKLKRSDFMALANALHLTEKQAENSFARLAGNLDDALILLENSFCSAEIKKQYKALIQSRATRLHLL